MFVVPALAGIRAKNRLKAGLQTVRFQPRAVYRAMYGYRRVEYNS